MRTRNCFSMVLSFWLVLSGSAQADLGGNEASIATDQAQMKATRRIVVSPLYTMHEIQLDSGTLVHEYLSPQGQVFAVAWNGPYLPDLQLILGSHFADYQAAANSMQTRRGPVQLQQPGLVIESSGRMRAFFGRAYLPPFLPASVAPNDIQ